MALPEIVKEAEVIEYVGMSTSLTEADEALLKLIKPLSERAIRSHCQCHLTFHQYTHYLPMADGVYERDRFISHARSARFGRLDSQRFSHTLFLPQRPLRSIISLNEDLGAYGGAASDAWGTNTALTEGTHYHADWDLDGLCMNGMLVRLSAAWPTKARSIRVVYEAGWRESEIDGTGTNPDTDATDLKLGALLTIANEFYTARRQRPTMHAGGDVVSERLLDYSVTYGREQRTIHIPPKAQQILERFRRQTSLVY